MIQLPELCLVKIISFLDSNSITTFLEYLKETDKSIYDNMYYRLNQIIRNNITVIREVEKIHSNIQYINTSISFMECYSNIFNLMRRSEKVNTTLQTILCYKHIVNKLNYSSLNKLTVKDKKKFNDIITTRYELHIMDNDREKHINVNHDKVSFRLNLNILSDYISLGINYPIMFN